MSRTGDVGVEMRAGRSAQQPRASRPWWKSWWFRWLVLPYLVLRVLAFMVFRSQQPAAIDALRRFNKHVTNPAMLRLAGKPHWYAARVEHLGRSSGKRYATPVVAVPIQGGFAIPLPYGTEVDWCQNLLAVGGGALQLHGRWYTVTSPVVLRSELVTPELALRWRLATRLYGFTHWVLVRTA